MKFTNGGYGYDEPSEGVVFYDGGGSFSCGSLVSGAYRECEFCRLSFF